MPDFKIGNPGPGRPSGGYTNSEHVPHLVAYVHPIEETRGSGSDSYQVALCDYVICIDICKKGWADVPVSGKALAPRLLSAGSSVVLARLTLGEAKEGRSAPVLAEDPIPEEYKDAQTVFEKYAVVTPSGKVFFDVDAFNANNAPPPVEATGEK